MSETLEPGFDKCVLVNEIRLGAKNARFEFIRLRLHEFDKYFKLHIFELIYPIPVQIFNKRS